ncbi:Methyltransferase domain-containing protein [Anaerocolumna jejuensis DSM 15929]|uniref:Methyltransferase domain-containing protein n=1 Tax=Anaerocolumna jejuensis DSM 15929 TaxID=1121322 RepID=A0A1M6RRK4_9FIRM|nr:class I SAM-dependent methyltransferase [Anaerocolumna jejuensis]SHK34947.1 Methyltransferase domain-containing protein [Anaerocolumna jejuensis DSM 15929]
MSEIFKQIPLYRFISYCDDTGLDKTVLDCGAGGDCPPLSLFSEYGYLTQGIEFSTSQLEEAEKYAKKKNQNLNIEQGDMRKLKFADETFSFVYSYNSVFHMKKEEVLKSVNEMKRVLKKDGLFFVNFLTVKDFRCGQGGNLGDNQYEQLDDNMPVIHSYYEEEEADVYFKDMKILFKETRVVERIFEGIPIRQGFVDYIAVKR